MFRHLTKLSSAVASSGPKCLAGGGQGFSLPSTPQTNLGRQMHGPSPPRSKRFQLTSNTTKRVTTETGMLRPFGRFLSQGVSSRQKAAGGLTSSTSRASDSDFNETVSSESTASADKESNEFVTYDAEKTLERLYKTYPQLHEYDRSLFVEYLDYMISESISVDNAVEMMLKYPSLLQTYNPRVPLTLSTLRGLGFSEKQRKVLIQEHPGLSDLSRAHLNKRMAFLKSWFSDAESLEVILNNVEALTDHESILKQKLRFLIMSASHETTSIMKSKSLSFPLSRIKCRHALLIRSGLFKPIAYNKMIKTLDKNKATKDQREKYFPPHQIVCFSDKAFLRACTNNAISLNELAAFEEMYAMELENETDDDEDDDGSSSEEEDNEDYNDTSKSSISSMSNNCGDLYTKSDFDQFYF